MITNLIRHPKRYDDIHLFEFPYFLASAEWCTQLFRNLWIKPSIVGYEAKNDDLSCF